MDNHPPCRGAPTYNHAVHIIRSGLHDLRQSSKCLSLVCDNVKSDEVCDKELILLQRDRLISCNKKILLTPAFHLIHGIHAIKFQDDHIFKEFHLTNL